MADRILWTEGQIGLMADRIVYVTEISEDNSVEVIFELTDSSLLMIDGIFTAYDGTFNTVASLPDGWIQQ